jgi:hypothetical protein
VTGAKGDGGKTRRDDLKRGPYQADKRDELRNLDSKRRRIDVTFQELSNHTGIGIATLRRMFKSGLAFSRQINAVRMALRSIEKDRKAAARLFSREDGQ